MKKKVVDIKNPKRVEETRAMILIENALNAYIAGQISKDIMIKWVLDITENVKKW